MHFAEFLNEGFPAHLRILSPPTCVGFGTGAVRLVRSFSRQCSTLEFASSRRNLLSIGSRPCHGDLPPCQPTAFDALFHSRAPAPCCVTPSSNDSLQYRNFCLLSIAYACCLGLGPDLPWVDERCPGSLRLSVDPILTDLFATHTSILTSMRSSCPSGQPSTPMERSPTDVLLRHATSVLYLSPGYFRRRASRPVSYYALFEWWLLLSQHPGCLGSPTSFST